MRTVTVIPPDTEEPAESLELAFLPLHKRAFGSGVAAAGALLVAAVTLMQLARSADPYPLVLLDRFFYGYTVSLTGALVGAFWAAVAGFVAGWFFAFCRNMALAMTVFVIRTRAELRQMRDFLDHI